MSGVSKTYVVAMLAMGVVTGCDCNPPPPMVVDPCKEVRGVQSDKLSACSATSECAEHYACRAVRDQEGLQCCTFADRECATEADCCPGQTCNKDGECFDSFTECTSDAKCTGLGFSKCEPYSDSYGTSMRCRYAACAADGGCAEGQSCFQGECVPGLPCEGTCAPGKACVPSSGRCQEYANPTDRAQSACPMTCAPGFLAAFKDARNIFDSCTLATVRCECAELPALRSTDLGRFSALTAAGPSELAVSAYDGEYGDLVVFSFGADGTKTGAAYVDGVPPGMPKYGPSGARGGIKEVGPDVGRHTDIAANGSTLYVSYYDVTNGDLKVATRTSGQWSNHRVDGVTADLGLYTSIALDPEGKPAIAYFQKAGDAAFDATTCPAPRPTGANRFITALKLARAKSPTPTSEADWDVKTLSCFARPPPPCDMCTGVCADPGTGTACLTAGSGCTGCEMGEVCVSVGGNAVCAASVTPSTLIQLTAGVGLFPSLAFRDGTAIIAYMERANRTTRTADGGTSVAASPEGDLWALTVDAAGTVSAPVLIDANGDTGFFPDVKIDPGTKAVAISYQDGTTHSLKFYLSAQLRSGVAPETIDTGVDATTPGNQSFVGSDSALVFGAGGALYALYQDNTRGDLKLAKRTSTWSVLASPRSEGAVGFFADAVLFNGKLFASHARLHAKSVNELTVLDNTLLLERLEAP